MKQLLVVALEMNNAKQAAWYVLYHAINNGSINKYSWKVPCTFVSSVKPHTTRFFYE